MSFTKDLINYCKQAATNEVNNFNRDQREKAHKAIVKHTPLLEKFMNGTYCYIGNSSISTVYADMFGEPVSELKYDNKMLDSAIGIHLKALVVDNYLSSGELLAENVFQKLYPRLLSTGVIYFIPEETKFEYTLPEEKNLKEENQIIDNVINSSKEKSAPRSNSSFMPIIEEDEEDGDVDWE